MVSTMVIRSMLRVMEGLFVFDFDLLSFGLFYHFFPFLFVHLLCVVDNYFTFYFVFLLKWT